MRYAIVFLFFYTRVFNLCKHPMGQEQHQLVSNSHNKTLTLTLTLVSIDVQVRNYSTI